MSRLRVLERGHEQTRERRSAGLGGEGAGVAASYGARPEVVVRRVGAAARTFETADSVEPVAFEALSRMMDEPPERIAACWRDAFNAARGS